MAFLITYYMKHQYSVLGNPLQNLHQKLVVEVGGPVLANIWPEVSAAGLREAIFVLRGSRRARSNCNPVAK